jgi:hypothetical protein
MFSIFECRVSIASNHHMPLPAELRRQLEAELSRAGFTASDLIEAVGDYFDRELTERGAEQTRILFALLMCRLRCQHGGLMERSCRCPSVRRRGPRRHFSSPAPHRAPAWAPSSICTPPECKLMTDDSELERIAHIVGVRRTRKETSRALAFRISVALQEEICAREREIADRETLLALVLHLASFPQLQPME